MTPRGDLGQKHHIDQLQDNDKNIGEVPMINKI